MIIVGLELIYCYIMSSPAIMGIESPSGDEIMIEFMFLSLQWWERPGMVGKCS